MTDETTSAGMSRREVLRRGAIVGGAGAVAWAAPSITALGPRAFAQTGTPSASGDISWIMVWFRCTMGETVTWHLVKYEGTASGYTQKCDATKANISADGAEGASYFDAQQAKIDANWVRSNSCPPDVTVSSSAGNLSVTASGTCEIVGWVLHDGSCGNPTGGQPAYPKFRSVEYPYKVDGDPNSGVVGPVASELPGGGTFQWEKCK
jgi:hypothetical protein